MNYAKIDDFEYVNGEGIGVSLFVSGCHFHCENCFNKEAWNFNFGSEWTEEVKNKFMKLLDDEHIKRVSFLGGEPLCNENVQEICNIISEIKIKYPDKKIWLYTGYTANLKMVPMYNPECNDKSKYPCFWMEPADGIQNEFFDYARELIVGVVDVLVDGQYIDSERDLSLKFKGSKNQRLIDVQKSLREQSVILYGGK